MQLSIFKAKSLIVKLTLVGLSRDDIEFQKLPTSKLQIIRIKVRFKTRKQTLSDFVGIKMMRNYLIGKENRQT